MKRERKNYDPSIQGSGIVWQLYYTARSFLSFYHKLEHVGNYTKVGIMFTDCLLTVVIIQRVTRIVSW